MLCEPRYCQSVSGKGKETKKESIGPRLLLDTQLGGIFLVVALSATLDPFVPPPLLVLYRPLLSLAFVQRFG